MLQDMNALRNSKHYALIVWLSASATLAAQPRLPGTQPLTIDGDPAADMVASIHTYLQRETSAASAKRAQRTGSGSRETLRKIIGAVDSRVPVTRMHVVSTTLESGEVAKGPGYRVLAVRWPVFDDVDAEGLLLQPDGAPRARIVAIPDADWSPEMLAGLAPGVDRPSQFARRLAENGCQVLIPVLIDRKDTWSGISGIRMTNQPHREWIYRMAYEAGRHIIGYEVQKVLAAIDWFEHENSQTRVPIGVAGYGEGGLLALHAASLDTRIESTLVSGYFQPREEVWKEPIYRDVWGLLKEFGDAELAAMIAPRKLIVEASRAPELDGPPAATSERKGAAPVGAIVTPSLGVSSQRGVESTTGVCTAQCGEQPSACSERRLARDLPGSWEALTALLRSMGVEPGRPVKIPIHRGTRAATSILRGDSTGSSINSSRTPRPLFASPTKSARNSGREPILRPSINGRPPLSL